jgi:hypothetical protein
MIAKKLYYHTVLNFYPESQLVTSYSVNTLKCAASPYKIACLFNLFSLKRFYLILGTETTYKFHIVRSIFGFLRYL